LRSGALRARARNSSSRKGVFLLASKGLACIASAAKDCLQAIDVPFSKGFKVLPNFAPEFPEKDDERKKLMKTLVKMTSPMLLALAWLMLASVSSAQLNVVRVLATGQTFPSNLLVDGARVYWIDAQNASVSSVDKVNGGTVMIHSPPVPLVGYDIQQDDAFLYFMRDSDGNCVYNPCASNTSLFRVPKTSSTITYLADCLSSGFAIQNAALYYDSAEHNWGPGPNPFFGDAIVSLPTQGGVETPLLWNSYEAHNPPSPNFPILDTAGYATDNGTLYWSQQSLSPGIIHIPLVGGIATRDFSTSDQLLAIATPTTGPLGGYLFWVDASNNSLMMLSPGSAHPIQIVDGIGPGHTGDGHTHFKCFTIIGEDVYCERGAGDIVRVSIQNGIPSAPATVVSFVDAACTVALASDTDLDGTHHLYWTDVCFGSVRTIALRPTPPPPTPTPTPTATPPPGACVPPPPGLMAWYSGEGNANDSQGSNNGALIGAGTTFPAGEVGKAFSFSGGGYVSVNNSASLNPTAAMTIDTWVKTTNASLEASMVNKFQHNNGTSSDDSYYLGINPGGGAGKVRWQLQTSAGDPILDSPVLNIFDGQFHHVAGTYDGTSMVIYVDGQVVASRSASGTIQATTTPVYLAAAMDHGSTARYFVGQLDEIEIFNRALTQSEIQSIFNAGSFGKCHSRLDNISTRAFVQTGDNVMIGGFIVQGTGPKRVIIRAIGPELGAPPYNIPNALANPRLELHNAAGTLIGSNDDWQHTIIGGVITRNQVTDIQNSGHAPANPFESAIIADLPPGNYTAIVSGVSNMTGVALVEVYDLSTNTASILGNISTRSFVQTGDNVMIGGFIVQGTGAKKVIVRAIGPELGAPPYNIPNALANPTLELHNGTGDLIASNDNWRTTIIGGIITSSQVRDIINSGYAPGDLRESAIIAELPPGNYTAIVRGVNDTTGVGLVEVYDLH
jgi:Concanavalin A-like lectin/glucanases superfamily